MIDYNPFYAKVHDIYNKSRMDDQANFEETVNLISSFFGAQTFLIDIGCGTGKYGKEFQKRGAFVIGIDKSKHQILEAKKQIIAFTADACQLPFEESSFDICTMIMMIHQLDGMHREKAIDETYRILKEGGKLIIKTASHEDLEHRFISDFFPSVLSIDKARYPSIKNLREQLSMFSSIEEQRIRLTITSDKDEWIRRIELRGGSNLGLISDKEFFTGLQNIRQTYLEDKIIQRDSWHTFLIATK